MVVDANTDADVVVLRWKVSWQARLALDIRLEGSDDPLSMKLDRGGVFVHYQAYIHKSH